MRTAGPRSGILPNTHGRARCGGGRRSTTPPIRAAAGGPAASGVRISRHDRRGGSRRGPGNGRGGHGNGSRHALGPRGVRGPADVGRAGSAAREGGPRRSLVRPPGSDPRDPRGARSGGRLRRETARRGAGPGIPGGGTPAGLPPPTARLVLDTCGLVIEKVAAPRGAEKDRARRALRDGEGRRGPGHAPVGDAPRRRDLRVRVHYHTTALDRPAMARP